MWPDHGHFELPGLWFTPDELYALLISHQLLDALQPGLFAVFRSEMLRPH